MKRHHPKTLRSVNLHALFRPGTKVHPDVLRDTTAFAEFLNAARWRILEMKSEKRATDTARLQKLISAQRKIAPIIRAVFSDRITPAQGAKKFKRLVPDETIASELFDIFDKAMKRTPEEVAKKKAELARAETDHARLERLEKANEAIVSGLILLTEAALAGDVDAAKYLANTAITGAIFLRNAEVQKAELFRETAAQNLHWPVLAGGEGGWEEEAKQRIAALGLGVKIAPFKVNFRRARGHDGNLPARLWAKAAVRAIEQCIVRFLSYAAICREFGSDARVMDFSLKSGWVVNRLPSWAVNVAGLPSFSQKSSRQWAGAIREMIREQVPDFHTHPDWENQRNTAKAAGRNTPGVIQNRILDDICDALERLAPELPEVTSRNSATELPQLDSGK